MGLEAREFLADMMEGVGEGGMGWEGDADILALSDGFEMGPELDFHGEGEE